MKAHVQTQPRAMLLWHFGPEAPGYDAVQAIAAHFGLLLRTVAPAEVGANVLSLCRGDAAPALLQPGPAALPQTAAVVFCGLPNETGELNAAVEALLASGANIPIKASVTPTSAGWSFAQLLAELGREHAAFAQGGPQA